VSDSERNQDSARDQLSAEEREAEERRRAALAGVLKFGDPVLKSRASEVTDFGEGLEREAERMVGIMRDALGVGLAATQLGVMRRVLVFQSGPDSDPRAIVNPEVEWSSADAVVAEEGCLSIPGVVVDVERPLHVRVNALDTGGKRIQLEAAGLEARILQHEIDHLDGVLILDRTERRQRRAALRALRAGEPFAPQMLEDEARPGEESGASEAGPQEEPTAAEPAER
jgi:peptide deformylase